MFNVSNISGAWEQLMYSCPDEHIQTVAEIDLHFRHGEYRAVASKLQNMAEDDDSSWGDRCRELAVHLFDRYI